jgi:nucleoside phosphorylase
MQTDFLTMKALQFRPEFMRFTGETAVHLAGRCLLDALEFLRIDPKWSARFGQLMNAHAIRLCWPCVKELRHDEMVSRVRPLIAATYVFLLEGRKDGVPCYGDDFWDWAYILEAMLVVFEDFKNDEREAALSFDIKTFYREAKNRLEVGLGLGNSDEWFGPALPTAAHRLLNRARPYLRGETDLDTCLARLKELALIRVVGGEYLERKARPDYQHWHLGQVIAEFPSDSTSQHSELSNLEEIDRLTETSQRAYALARVVQGAVASGDEGTRKRALSMLYRCQDLSRPLGSGIIGDHVKASLNTLEALWPTLDTEDRVEVRSMIEALLGARRRSNRTGILVAVKHERDACIKVFEKDRARVVDDGDVIEIDHADYQAVILTGKALIGATHATLNLISAHNVTRTIMIGIAGSLGQKDRKGKFIGPDKGDVVIASSTAAYRVREKVRETIVDAPVPFDDSTWGVLPADVTLFSEAHRVKLKLGRKHTVYEGLIVTGNGVKDQPEEKKSVREKWPGGLAVAEEGFASALECLLHRIPYLEIRGISDRAEGDKAKQKRRPAKEGHDQKLAAGNAAQVMLALVKSLGRNW